MRDQIAEWLGLLIRPDDVFEVRALTARGPLAGWFRGSDAGRAADRIAAAEGEATGVYFTPQRLDPAVLGRGEGVLARPGRTPLTADADVLARRYLLIDVDPVRAEGHKRESASGDEKAAAAAVAGGVMAYLERARWPRPVVVDSGNGWHLYYRLPADEPGGPVDDPTGDELATLLWVLKARFDAPAAAIDPTVYNASRIMKVPGTWARKGPHTSERPHRQSRVTEVPDDWHP